MVRKLEEEVARLEGVVQNMKRKLASLRRLRGMEMGEHGDEDQRREGEAEDLKAVLERNLGSGWGGVL